MKSRKSYALTLSMINGKDSYELKKGKDQPSCRGTMICPGR